MRNGVLQPGVGPIRAPHHLPADPSAVLWGRLPCSADSPVLTIDAGDEVTIDTFSHEVTIDAISHEGIHEGQGRDPRAFFGAFRVDPDGVLTDAVALRSPCFRPDSHSTPHTPMRTSAWRRTSTFSRSWIS